MIVLTLLSLTLLGMVPLAVLAKAPARAPEAGPPVHYTDQTDDAYRIQLAEDVSRPNGETIHMSVPASIPDESKSQPAFDILRVDWRPVGYVNKRSPGGYSTSITVAGAARTDGSYVSYGEFSSDTPGEKCQLYHFLTPGIRSFGNAFCGTNETGTRRLIGQVQGGQVSVTQTPSGGTVLTATFDNRAIPALLQASNRTLEDLSAFTCVQGDEGLGCRLYEVFDSAASSLTYRV
jgi:hypothetical protein